MKPNIVVFTGAGISAESGIKTFRDSDGLWENHKIEDVATPEAWQKNPALVQSFYNQRRKAVMEALPNQAHFCIAEFQDNWNLKVITQNIDDLHERAGSKSVLHLHGEIMLAKSSIDDSLRYPLQQWELNMDAKCAKGSALRPHVVWFGEAVPEMIPAFKLVSKADVFIVVGTSLQVYPAASLAYELPSNCELYMVDKTIPDAIKSRVDPLHCFEGNASEQLPKLMALLREKYKA